MTFYIKKWFKIFKMYCYVLRLQALEWLESKSNYRKFRGGVWYYVSCMYTGDEYWTNQKPHNWDAYIINIEDYNEVQ